MNRIKRTIAALCGVNIASTDKTQYPPDAPQELYDLTILAIDKVLARVGSDFDELEDPLYRIERVINDSIFSREQYKELSKRVEDAMLTVRRHRARVHLTKVTILGGEAQEVIGSTIDLKKSPFRQ